jgi:hypothetical protein
MGWVPQNQWGVKQGPSLSGLMGKGEQTAWQQIKLSIQNFQGKENSKKKKIYSGILLNL